jgi:hypothetical protein
MRRVSVCCCVALVIGCGKVKEQPAADTAAAAPAEEPMASAPAPISLADVAGKWTMHTMAADADSVLVTYELVATGDTSGWMLNFPKRKPVRMQVQVSGDSIIGQAGPYESVLQKGVQVTTNSVMRLQNGKLVGTSVAHYAGGTDTLRNLRIEGTKSE